MSHKYSKETLYHFQCSKCQQWWTIGDWHISPNFKGTLTCPACCEYDETEEREPLK